LSAQKIDPRSSAKKQLALPVVPTGRTRLIFGHSAGLETLRIPRLFGPGVTQPPIVDESLTLMGVIGAQIKLRLASGSTVAGAMTITVPPDAPWLTTEGRAAIDSSCRHAFSLFEALHAPGTYNAVLHRWNSRTWRSVSQRVALPRPTPPKGFAMHCVAGIESATPYHCCFGLDRPLQSLAELRVRDPTYITCDGDGTVPLHSALAHDFADTETGGTTFFASGVSHIGLMSAPVVHEHIWTHILEPTLR
jgi:hypothetical protein